MDTTYQGRHRAAISTTTGLDPVALVLAHSQGRAATTRAAATATTGYTTSPRVAAARSTATKADAVGELVRGLHRLQRSGRQ